MARLDQCPGTVFARLCAGWAIGITASIGVACLSDKHYADFDTLYKDADKAVYLSKENGRNRVTFFEDGDTQDDAG